MFTNLYVRKVSVPEEIGKYKATAVITKEINSLAATLPADCHAFYMEKLNELRREISISDPQPIISSVTSEENIVNENVNGKRENDKI